MTVFIYLRRRDNSHGPRIRLAPLTPFTVTAPSGSDSAAKIQLVEGLSRFSVKPP